MEAINRKHKDHHQNDNEITIQVFGNGITRVSSSDLLKSSSFQRQLNAAEELRILLERFDNSEQFPQD